MVLPDPLFDALADRFGEQVAQRASEAFELMWQLLQEDETLSPQEAAQQAQQQFTDAFVGDLAAAFGELLARAVGTVELLAMPVGDIVLSRRLYLQAEQTTAEVAALVRQHAQGVQQARELALRLYDGYDPKDGIVRPLEGTARAELPRALRELTADPEARARLEDLVEYGQKQAARLKTKALRASYLEAFEAWKSGAGAQALKRKLWVAQREKNRFAADRIAQTELARAHQAQVGAELMADDLVDVVQILMNPTHPRPDICDLHAGANLFGLGPGCYPKPLAPVPTYHPFCRCKMRSRPSLSAAAARPLPGGEAAYLRSLEPEKAAAIAGSAERARRIMDGVPLAEVIDAGRPEPYRLRRLGDGAAHPLVKNAEMAFNETGQQIVSGLISAAQAAPADPAARLEALWANHKRFAPHVRRRLEDGSVTSAQDYAQRTFEVLARAHNLVVVEPKDPAMRPTGMVQLASKDWIVLLSAEGRIVTSYRRVAEKIQFEQRHTEAGDHVHKHTITASDRAALAQLFGGR